MRLAARPDYCGRSVFLAALFCWAAAAQIAGTRQGGGGTTPAGGSTGANPSVNTGTSSPSPSPGYGAPGFGGRPIVLSGRVIVAGGASLPGPATIERVCNFRPYREAYTDFKGYFNFEVRQSSPSMLPDASDSAAGAFGRAGGTGNSGMGSAPVDSLTGCELRAELTGYRSNTVPLAGYKPGDNSNVGTIVLYRAGADVQGSMFSATSGLAPKSAQKAFEKGKDLVRRGRPDEGQKELVKAVGLYPKYAEAWYELGQLYRQRNHATEARDAYTKSIAADGKFGSPYEGLYLLAFKESKWQEMADASDHLLRTNAYEFGRAYYFNAVANLELGQWDAAERSALEAVKAEGDQANPRALFLLGLIQVEKKDFEAAGASLREFLRRAPAAPERAEAEKLLAQVAPQ